MDLTPKTVFSRPKTCTISLPFCLRPDRVIDPFRQVKREYGEILEDADFANRISLIYIVLTIKREGVKR